MVTSVLDVHKICYYKAIYIVSHTFPISLSKTNIAGNLYTFHIHDKIGHSYTQNTVDLNGTWMIRSLTNPGRNHHYHTGSIHTEITQKPINSI